MTTFIDQDPLLHAACLHASKLKHKVHQIFGIDTEKASQGLTALFLDVLLSSVSTSAIDAETSKTALAMTCSDLENSLDLGFQLKSIRGEEETFQKQKDILASCLSRSIFENMFQKHVQTIVKNSEDLLSDSARASAYTGFSEELRRLSPSERPHKEKPYREKRDEQNRQNKAHKKEMHTGGLNMESFDKHMEKFEKDMDKLSNTMDKLFNNSSGDDFLSDLFKDKYAEKINIGGLNIKNKKKR